MGLPQPKHPLNNHCSVIHEDTLYVYSPAGFQSLELSEGAQWQKLPMDVSLTGGQCVKATPNGDPNSALLYIVGGSVNDTASTWDYPGLMHYSFAQKKWDWVRPESWVTQNRQNHAAVYLNASQSILVYSGSQTTGDNSPSSSTFLISTLPPFTVRSGTSAGAPPAVKPMLMPWDERSAVMFGGGAQNEEVFLFDPEGGWRNLSVTLTEPITNMDAVQCTIVSGDDGSKVLERYDMSMSPNQVTRFALLNQGGIVAAPGTIVGEKAKRVTINEWPAYNATLAPTVTRAGYSIAQNSNGIAVITGGSEEDPLCIFDQKANTWVNATELFNGQQVIISSVPSSTASISTVPATSTPSAAASSTAAAPAPATTPVNNKTRMLTVLGATLGAIFGIAAILILLLFCIKYRRDKKKKAQQAGYIEKDRLSFADRGAEFMSEAGGSIGHNYSASQNASQSSLAIISGRGGQNHKRGLGPLGSDASTAGLVMKKSPLGYSEPVEMSKFDIKPTPIIEEKSLEKAPPSQPASRPAPNIGRSRSSGWSRYFANNEATNLAHMPSGRSTYASERTSTGSQSLYTDSRMYSQPSQTVPPLELNFTKFEGQRISRVATGSPTLGNSRENLPSQPMQAELGRANSNGSSRSGVSDDHYHKGPVESWTPMAESNYNNRPPSSNYTNSVVVDRENRDGASSYYPESVYPKSGYSSFYPGQPKIGATEDRDSTVTVFPRGVPENSGPVGRKGPEQDMSWLNLGAGK